MQKLLLLFAICVSSSVLASPIHATYEFCNEKQYDYCERTRIWGAGNGFIQLNNQGPAFIVTAGGRSSDEKAMAGGHLQAFRILKFEDSLHHDQRTIKVPVLVEGDHVFDTFLHKYVYAVRSIRAE